MVKLVITAVFFLYFPFWFAKNSTLKGRSKWFFIPFGIAVSVAGIAALVAASFVMLEFLKSNNVFNSNDANRFFGPDLTYWFIGTLFVLPFSLWQGVRKARRMEIDLKKEGSQ
jgi:hypothetical protein